MKVEIEDYRGWAISFDNEEETFYCHSEHYDRDKHKQSYSQIKKWIDDFIKDNEKFEPFYIESKPDKYGKEGKLKVIGIRKDKRFVYENTKGVKHQLADYEESYYILYDEENEKFKAEAQQLDDEIEKLRLKRNAVLKNINGVEITEYKKELILKLGL